MGKPFVVFAAMWVLGGSLAFVSGMNPVVLLAVEGALGFAAVLFFRYFAPVPIRFVFFCLLTVMLSTSYFAWTDANNVSDVRFADENVQKLAEEEGIDVTAEGIILSRILTDGDRVSFVMRVDHLQWGRENLSPKEKMQIEIRLLHRGEQTKAEQMERGSLVRLGGKLERPGQARNFGGFDYRGYLKTQRIHWVIRVHGLEAVTVKTAKGLFHFTALLRWADGLRNRMAERLEQMFPKEQAGFFQSLLIGLRDDLSPELFDRFSQIGITHIIAISGLHVAVFVGAVLTLMGVFGFTRETRILTAFVLLPLYVLLTGAAPSALRAGIMGMLALAAAYRHRLKNGYNLIAAAALVMLVYEPYYLLNVSFQLSFLVTLGLIWGAPRLSGLIPIRNRWLNGLVSVTIAAQLVSFPLTIYYFNEFSLLSFPANFLIVPWVSLFILPLGTAALLCGSVLPFLGRALGWLTEKMTFFLFWTVEQFSEMEFFHTIWATPSRTWVILYYLLLVSLVEACLKRKGINDDSVFPRGTLSFFGLRLAPVFLGAGFVILLIWGYFPDVHKRYGEIDFIDVGQGDAILIRSPEGKYLLVDGGGTFRFYKKGEEWKRRKNPFEVGKDLLVPLLKKRGVRYLDAVIATHGDTDHTGGLLQVVREIPVGKLLFNGTKPSGGAFLALLEEAVKRDIPVISAKRGMRWDVDRYTRIHFLYPPIEEAGSVFQEVKSQNSHSIVFLLQIYDRSFLFSGDIPQSEEDDVILAAEKAGKYHVDLLKVAHHGSKTSTSEEWLAFWRPVLSVISVGKNNLYGHPHDEVTERLIRYNSAVLRTDIHGEIQLRVYNNELLFRSKLRR